MFIRYILNSVFSVIASCLFAGCTLGYKNDGKEVTWNSWNEGWGQTSFKVDADPKTFKSLGGGYGRDSRHVFFMGGIIDGAAPTTFKTHKDGYACDKNHVFFHDSIIVGADPLSFWLVDLNDGNDQIAYDMKRIYKGKDTPAFRQYFKKRYKRDFQ